MDWRRICCSSLSFSFLWACGGKVATDVIAQRATDGGDTENGCAEHKTVCGGACTDTSSDVHHCGDCNNDCSDAPNAAIMECQAGVCLVTSCDSGFADCDMNSRNGCESALSQPASCGACGVVCPERKTVCEAASVSFACVVPPPPRLLAPLSTSTVTSRRPTMRWSPPPNVTDATIDLCSDRKCAKRIGAPIHVTGASATPTSDLPTGVVYWRVHPSVATDISSPTWEFTVGQRSAALSASWGTTLDINGDGYSDVAIAAPYVISTIAGDTSYAGSAYVYVGGASGIGNTPAFTLPGIAAGGQVASVASAGDVNGDGFADLVVGAPGPTAANQASDGTGNAYVYLGSAAGLAFSPAITLVGPDGAGGNFGATVGSAGDVNGDGYADVLVYAANAGTQTPRAYLFLGGASGLNATPHLLGTPANDSPLSVIGAGDVNGDGYGDMLVGGTLGGYLYLGSATGVASSPSVQLASPSSYFGRVVASAGDLNGDGYADVIVADSGAGSGGRAWIFLGGASMSSTAAATLNSDGSYDGAFGISASSAGDLNRDGYDDIVVGAYAANAQAGRAYVYYGGPSGLSASADTTLLGDNHGGDFFGFSVAGAGDVNGDSCGVLIFGVFGYGGETGQSYLFLGGTSGATISTTLSAPDAGGWFGASVAVSKQWPASLPVGAFRPSSSERKTALIESTRSRRQQSTRPRIFAR